MKSTKVFETDYAAIENRVLHTYIHHYHKLKRKAIHSPVEEYLRIQSALGFSMKFGGWEGTRILEFMKVKRAHLKHLALFLMYSTGPIKLKDILEDKTI